MALRACSIEGCTKSGKLTRGWCVTHYNRWVTHGDPEKTLYIRNDPERRFWIKVTKTPSCWEWNAAKSYDGYGLFNLGGKSRKAHRVAYTFVHGGIPEGKELDHVCRNRACVRPDHLRPVTNKQNAEHRDSRGRHSSGYRSVHWHKASNKWSVCVYHNGERHHGGYFLDVHEAGAVARDIRNALYTHNEIDRTPHEPSNL